MKMARGLLVWFGVSLLLAGAGCERSAVQPARAARAAARPAVKPAPATPIANKKQELGDDTTWNPEWSAYIERALPPDMLSQRAAVAVRSYCPRFAQESNVDKRVFWAYLFQALAGAESGLNPTTDVHHLQPAVDKIDKGTRRPIRQEGLLQLTYEDRQRYGCAFDWQRDRRLPIKDPERSILQPEKNLSCGIRIMENQIIDQGKPLIVRSSYWSTLRPGTESYRVFAKQMANVPAACGVGRLKPRRHRRAG